MKLVIVTNSLKGFISHRLPIGEAALKRGDEVYVVAPFDTEALSLSERGFKLIDFPISRQGASLLQEFILLIKLWSILQNLKPSILHLVTIKPVLYGTLVTKFLLRKVPTIAAISGLGSVFIATGFKAMIRRKIVVFWYWLSFVGSNALIVFQNKQDLDFFAKRHIGNPKKYQLINGSGVDTNKFFKAPEPPGPIVVSVACRLLTDKGILEFCRAAEILRSRDLQVVMQVAGEIDPGNPSSLNRVDLEKLEKQQHVSFLGEVCDVNNLYAKSHIVCLPSYREGLPKSLIEAASCGRAVVTTDAPGCREAIIPNRTGLLVPVADAEALADAIEALIVDPNRRKRMGDAGRGLAVKKYDINLIVRSHLKLYDMLKI